NGGGEGLGAVAAAGDDEVGGGLGERLAGEDVTAALRGQQRLHLGFGEIARSEFRGGGQAFEDDIGDAVIVGGDLRGFQGDVHFETGHGAHGVVGRSAERGGVAVGDDHGFVEGGVGKRGARQRGPGRGGVRLDGGVTDAGECHVAEEG